MLRYNVPGWLELEAAARPLFHRQHGVMAELAKWLVPILCRGPGEVRGDHRDSILAEIIQCNAMKPTQTNSMTHDGEKTIKEI